MGLAQCVARARLAREEKQKEDQKELGTNCEPLLEHLLCDRYCTDALHTFL